jgi:hypothetical protein
MRVTRWAATDGGTYLEHAAGITVKAVLDHGDVEVDHIALFQLLWPWNAMTDYMID